MQSSLKMRVRKTINLFCDSLWTWTALPWPERGPEPATLIISPHPDDDVLGCAGLMSTRKSDGEILHVLYLTDGSASHPGHPVLLPQPLALQRRKEAQRAATSLGLEMNDLHFLDLQDGTLSALSPEDIQRLSDKLKSLIQTYHYDEIFTPFHCDGSAEHESTFRMIKSFTPENIRLYEYPVWSRWSAWRLLRFIFKRPHACVFPSSDLRQKKNMAIKSHESQFHSAPPWKKAVIPKGFTSLFVSDREFFFIAHDTFPTD